MTTIRLGRLTAEASNTATGALTIRNLCLSNIYLESSANERRIQIRFLGDPAVATHKMDICLRTGCSTHDELNAWHD